MHYFENLPPGVFNELGDWQSRIVEACPLADTAISYAENNRVVLLLEQMQDSKGGADFITRETFVDIIGSGGMPDFLNTASHEIKHVRHIDSDLAVSAWRKLGEDLSRSRERQKPLSKKAYALPLITDALLIPPVTEVDCHTYGDLAGYEAEIAFGKTSGSPVTQKIIGARHRRHMRDAERHQHVIMRELNFIEGYIDGLIYHEQLYGFRPYIHWTSVTMQALQGIAKSFWGENCFLSGFAGENGMKDLRVLRGCIVNNERLMNNIEYCREALVVRKNRTPLRQAAMAQCG